MADCMTVPCARAAVAVSAEEEDIDRTDFTEVRLRAARSFSMSHLCSWLTIRLPVFSGAPQGGGQGHPPALGHRADVDLPRVARQQAARRRHHRPARRPRQWRREDVQRVARGGEPARRRRSGSLESEGAGSGGRRQQRTHARRHFRELAR